MKSISREARRKHATENRRQAILDAARTVLARKGYAQTTIDDVAEAAGIAKGTVYLYFESKEQIYLTAVLEKGRELEALVRKSVAAADTWYDKIRTYMEVKLRFLEEHSDFFRVYATEFRSMCMRGQPLNAEIYELIRESERQLAQIVAVAVARGEARPVDPDLTATLISDLNRGLVDRRLLGTEPRGSAADLEFTLDMLYRALAADPTQPPKPAGRGRSKKPSTAKSSAASGKRR